jgi:outer membrane protein TolC
MSQQLTKKMSELNIKHALFIKMFFLLLLFYNPLAAQTATMTGIQNLNSCIEFGLQNNPKYHSSRYIVEESKAKIQESFSGYYPSVNLNSDADTYSKNNGSQRYNNFNTGVSLSYSIYEGNRKKSAYGAAQNNYEANIQQHETVKQDLVFSIIRAYYQTLRAERILKSTEEAVKNSLLHLEFANAKQKAGMATRSDILKSEVELSNAGLTMIKAQNDLLISKGNLNQLLGLPSDYEIELVDDLSSLTEITSLSFDSLVNEAINSRTEIKRYQAMLEAQQKYILVAKGGYYPSLSANANYNYAGAELSSLQQNWWLGMSLTIPVFKGFANKARVTQEEFALKSLEKDLELLKQQVSQEVWNAWIAVKEATERISASIKITESAKENLAIAEGEYKEGIGSIIQLTDAQTTFVTVEQNYIQALADYKISYAELERTIGKM